MVDALSEAEVADSLSSDDPLTRIAAAYRAVICAGVTAVDAAEQIPADFRGTHRPILAIVADAVGGVPSKGDHAAQHARRGRASRRASIRGLLLASGIADEFTAHELKVASHVLEGMKVEAVAKELHVSLSTLRGVVRSMCHKMGVRSIRELRTLAAFLAPTTARVDDNASSAGDELSHTRAARLWMARPIRR